MQPAFDTHHYGVALHSVLLYSRNVYNRIVFHMRFLSCSFSLLENIISIYLYGNILYS